MFFYFLYKKIEDIQELVFCVSARLLWDAGNYDFAIFNLLMIRCLLAAAKPYVAIGDEKLTLISATLLYKNNLKH